LSGVARRSFWTDVTIFTAVVTFVGGVATSAIAFFGNSGQAQIEFDRDVCKMAYETLGDDTPNPLVPKAVGERFVADQLILARKCAGKIK